MLKLLPHFKLSVSVVKANGERYRRIYIYIFCLISIRALVPTEKFNDQL